jgi:hypothetical protein
LESRRAKQEGTHQKSQDRLAKAAARQAEVLREKEKSVQADAVKTARLRGLRLAKEAADKELLAKEAAEKVLSSAQSKRTGSKTRKLASGSIGHEQ